MEGCSLSPELRPGQSQDPDRKDKKAAVLAAACACAAPDAADQVEAGSDHVGHLPATGQVPAHGHLEEVEGGVQAVLVQLQLVPQVVDVAPP